jgi:hypothetical protein
MEKQANLRLNKILSHIQLNPVSSIKEMKSKNNEEIRPEKDENSSSLNNAVALVVLSQLRGSL